MKKRVAVSFEGSHVKVVYASQGKGKVIIHRAVLLDDEAFDDFLKKNKMPNLVLVYPFRKFYSDVISVPPVKKSFLKTIIESEIRKRFPDLREFSFFYKDISDRPADEKGAAAREIFFFAVEESEIRSVIERFDKNGKTISMIFPEILPLVQITHQFYHASTKIFLCLFSSAQDKVFFLVRGEQIRFIRVTPSTDIHINESDIDNINMTVNYCRQKLRTSPDELILFNTSIKTEAAKGKLIIPALDVDLRNPFGISEEAFREYMLPLSAIITSDLIKEESLLPKQFRTLYNQRLYVSYAAILFMIISLFGFGYLAINLAQINDIKDNINVLRSEIAGVEKVVATYDRKREDLNKNLPVIQLLNESRSTIDIQKTLLLLDFLPMEKVKIQSIMLNNKKTSVTIQISGVVSATSLSEMHYIYQKLANNFDKREGVNILSKSIDLKTGQFQIDAENKPL